MNENLVENLKAPAKVVQAKEPVDIASPIDIETVDKGVWRLTGGTTVLRIILLFLNCTVVKLWERQLSKKPIHLF